MDSDRSTEPEATPRPTATALRIAALYALIGGLWILFSDSALLLLVRDARTMAHVAIAKGWVYVVVTAAILFGLVRRALVRLDRSQEALRRSKEAYQLLVENQTDLVVKVDTQGRLLFVNPSYCELFGKTQRELVGASFWPLVHEDDRAAFQTAIHALSAPPHAGTLDHRALTAKGYRWIAWTGKAVLGADGEVASISAVGRDVTERKEAQEALARHARRLEALKELEEAILAARSPAEVAAAAVTHLRRLVPCRRVSVALLDPASAALRVTVDDLDPAAPRSTTAPAAFLADLGGRGVRNAADLGEDRWAGAVFDHLRALGLRCAIAAPLLAEDAVAGLLVLASEREGSLGPEHESIAEEVANLLTVALNEARLRTALTVGRERLRSVIDHLPEGVVVLDEARRVTLANSAAGELLPCLGVSVPRLHGLPLDTLAGVPIDDLLRAPAATADSWRELRSSGPRPRIFEVTGRRLATEGAARGSVLVIREVTGDRALREELQHQENLAAVGQLAAGIAHDFNNLLQGIVMYAELLLRGQRLEPRDTERAEGILTQGLRGADLIRQILDFSRRSVSRRERLALEPFVDAVVRLLRSTIPESIRIEWEPTDGPHLIDGDAAQLQRALTNLALNARDAMPDGGTLCFRLSSWDLGPSDLPAGIALPPGRWIRLDVSDTGTGIPPEVQPHVFQPFFTTKEVGRGTGLGLAQVYGIVTGHGGFIDLETASGRGTTFTLYLPEASDAAPAPTGPAPAPPAAGRGETILLVEDDGAARDVARDGLEALGYRVLAVADGAEALRLWEARRTEVDLVLSDTVMPGMGGVELARALRAKRCEAGIVLMSGYPPGDMGQEAILDWIEKPFSFEELGRRIRSALDARAGQRGSADDQR